MRLYSNQLLSVDRPQTVQTAPASTPPCLPTPYSSFPTEASHTQYRVPCRSGNCYYLITLSSLQSLNDVIVSATPFEYSSMKSPTSHSKGSRPHVTELSLQRTCPRLYKLYTISHSAQNISFRDLKFHKFQSTQQYITITFTCFDWKRNCYILLLCWLNFMELLVKV